MSVTQDVSIERAALLDRIQAEFREMPGLTLTTRQARRLWCLDEQACEDLLDALVEQGFLRRTAADAALRLSINERTIHGSYARA